MALNNSRLIAYVEGGFLLILLLLAVQQLSGLGSGTTEEGLRALPPGPMRADADTCELQRHQNAAAPANVGITTGKAYDSPHVLRSCLYGHLEMESVLQWGMMQRGMILPRLRSPGPGGKKLARGLIGVGGRWEFSMGGARQTALSISTKRLSVFLTVNICPLRSTADQRRVRTRPKGRLQRH